MIFQGDELIMKSNISKTVTCAMFAALACAATMVIQIPSPMSGYVNPGDCVVLLGAYLLGPVYGAAAGGIGSMLADLISGYVIYVPGTLVIKAAMGFAAGALFTKIHNKKTAIVIGGVTAELIMILGYFLYAMLLMGKGLAAAASIPGNIFQGIVGIVGSFILYFIIEKAWNKNR